MSPAPPPGEGGGPVEVAQGRGVVVVGGVVHAGVIGGAGAVEDVVGQAAGGRDDAVAVEDDGPAVNDIIGWGVGSGVRHGLDVEACHVVGGDDVAVVFALVDDETFADAAEVGKAAGGLGDLAGAGEGGEKNGDEQCEEWRRRREVRSG